MTVHQLWNFPRASEDLAAMQSIRMLVMQQLTMEEFHHMHDHIWSYHSHSESLYQCSSIVVQRIQAPVPEVWSVVRRFDNPQLYKRFIRSCSMSGDGQVGSTRQLELVSGLPAASSTERLEILDEEKHVLSFTIVGGQHRLRNYRSVTTLHESEVNGKPATIVMESYLVDVPEGNSKNDTRVFADTIVKFNLQTLARISEFQGRRDGTRSVGIRMML